VVVGSKPLVIIALVADGTLNCDVKINQKVVKQTLKHTSSAANLSTAVNGAFSGTLTLYTSKKSTNKLKNK
jgi:hypothetical protein